MLYFTHDLNVHCFKFQVFNSLPLLYSGNPKLDHKTKKPPDIILSNEDPATYKKSTQCWQGEEQPDSCAARVSVD